MKLYHMDLSTAERIKSPVCEGAEILRQPMTDNDSKTLRVGIVEFRDGARTKMHTHDGDQVAVILKGEGLFTTEDAEYHVKEGDVLLFSAGEVHSHGAEPGKSVVQLGIRAVTGGNSANTSPQK